MELINATRMTAGYTLGMEPSGRELLVVVIKGTFALPKAGEQVRLHDEQLPLIIADTFTGEPGFSSPVQENDFAPRKCACDVLLTGHARAPAGRQVTRLRAGLRVGPMEKVFDVVGDRVWRTGVTGISASAPKPFTEMPVSYDRAFGGSDQCSKDQSQHDAYLPNPVGRGWHKHVKNAWVDGTPLPNIEELGKAVSFPSDRYRPMALGPLGRGWPHRACYAGTYDQQWLDDHFPFLPCDFDERYYQGAPLDQQIPISNAPLEIMLLNFTSDTKHRFSLPTFNAPVEIFTRDGGSKSVAASLDTIVFEPDSDRFALSWRVTRPLLRSIFEVAQVTVGKSRKVWQLQRDQMTSTGVANSDSASVGG